MKIPTKRVKSDDCIIHVGRRVEGDQIVDDGKAYSVHKGEWVEVIPIITMRQYIEVNKLSGALGNADPKELEQSLDRLCHDLANRLQNWNWTDLKGNALPQPDETVLKDLTEEELLYLVTVCQGESQGERKNASTPSGRKSSGAKSSQPQGH